MNYRTRSMNYILKPDHTVEPCDDMLEWARSMNLTNRRVAATDVGEYWISTVFLGIDHNYTPDGPPLLFETMVKKNGNFLDYRVRYVTWDEAVEGHKLACMMAEMKPELLEDNDDD